MKICHQFLISTTTKFVDYSTAAYGFSLFLYNTRDPWPKSSACCRTCHVFFHVHLQSVYFIKTVDFPADFRTFNSDCFLKWSSTPAINVVFFLSRPPLFSSILSHLMDQWQRDRYNRAWLWLVESIQYNPDEPESLKTGEVAIANLLIRKLFLEITCCLGAELFTVCWGMNLKRTY